MGWSYLVSTPYSTVFRHMFVNVVIFAILFFFGTFLKFLPFSIAFFVSSVPPHAHDTHVLFELLDVDAIWHGGPNRYITLTVLQTLYAYFVEGDTVFVGKRKTFDKRVRPLRPPSQTLHC